MVASRLGCAIGPLIIIYKNSSDFWYPHYIALLLLPLTIMVLITFLPETAGFSNFATSADLIDAFSNEKRLKMSKILSRKKPIDISE